MNAQTLGLRGNRYDVVTLTDVLEHIPEPVALLTSIARLVEPGGWIAIKVPCGASQWLKERTLAAVSPSRRISLADNLVHVNHFSPRALARALARAGFRQTTIQTAPPELLPSNPPSVVHIGGAGAACHLRRRTIAGCRLHAARSASPGIRPEAARIMSRLRRAAVAASFGYLQYLVAIVSGIVMVPVTLHYLGARRYGLWLASGELLGYAAMVDLGVIGVLPWIWPRPTAARTARRCAPSSPTGWLSARLSVSGTPCWRRTVAAPAVGPKPRRRRSPGHRRATRPAGSGCGDCVSASRFQRGAHRSSGCDLQRIAGCRAGDPQRSHYRRDARSWLWPLRHRDSFRRDITGVVVAALLRTAILAPDLLRHLPRPTWPMVGSLLGNGLGVWCSTFGWQLLAASNGLVMTALGRLEWVAVYACTAKLSSIATQLTWVMPDAGLVGLAQVHGEGRGTDRVRTLVLMMLRLHLLLAGGAACGLLAFNPAFVTGWVGPNFFGGLPLNSLLAAGIVVSSFIHGLLSAASVVGPRRQVGLVAILNGVAQIACAVMFGRAFGLPGIAGAAVIAGLVTSVPGGIRLLRSATALTGATIWRNLVGPWLWRFTPLVVIAASCGFLSRDRGVAVGLALGTCCGLGYVWHMRPLYAALPFDPRWSRWLVSLRLVPAPEVERA